MIGRLMLALGIVAASVAGCGGNSSAQEASGRVTVGSGGILLDGQRWEPYGFNAYQLATDWNINSGCGAAVDLDRFFAALPRRSLVRFDAFQALATNRVTGELNFAPIDAVFAAAERHDQLLIPVLSPQDGSCDGNRFKERQWYVDGWHEAAAPFTLSFRDWMTAAADRWKDSHALAAWELVGEPETSTCADAACSWSLRDCTADAATVLRAFFDTAGAELRRHDPRTLITAGLAGGGQCGAQGDEYRTVGASPFVDVLQYHDYGADTVALPGDEWNGLGQRLRQAAELGKPLLVGEVGELAGSCESVDARAANIDAKLDGQRAAGAAGALVWSFVPDPRTQACTYDVGYDDPLWSVVARHADRS
ncbi:cellulase family glycosylhydrolase [Antrihabitans sp. YC2-6]|uniref:cellulase family glycosylhydrolase n=1 Tax=Antrihabitans sp. YC2-6 TaxID=2799498 RepID=UPI001F347A25|nr:cellulase family glycosylhydrolase [Antrihabitans sp. YC2-6]